MLDNKAIVRRYIERVWDEEDFAAIDETIKPNYIQHSRVVGQSGREPVKAFFRMVHSAFSDVGFAVDDMMSDGDKVIWRWTLRGKHVGVFQGVPPTGKEFALTGISILRLEDGKFAELWVEQDTMGLLQQLGVIPTPG